jgi:hypothetical protein
MGGMVITVASGVFGVLVVLWLVVEAAAWRAYAVAHGRDASP